jgi:response regulator RpfG family c-di-GMP phosphodiesterase
MAAMVAATDASGNPGFCRHCGAPLSGGSYLREQDEYGCESCFLAARKQRALPPGSDDAQFALAETLVCALDAREHETGQHSKRVACHTLVLARRFTLDPQQLRQIYWGVLLHDIGKIGIPDSILMKRDGLSSAEWEIMRTHPEIGHRILSGAKFMADAAEIVLAHEERFDGTGYPNGLAGDAIPLWARLFAVIDTLDAMTSDRPYRARLSFEAARAEIMRQAGNQFDPRAVDAFLVEDATLRQMVALKCAADPLRGAAPLATPTRE